MATSPNARGFMVQALLDLGHTREAEQVSEGLRRGRPATPETYHLVGEAWEAVGDLTGPTAGSPAGSCSPRARPTRLPGRCCCLGGCGYAAASAPSSTTSSESCSPHQATAHIDEPPTLKSEEPGIV